MYSFLIKGIRFLHEVGQHPVLDEDVLEEAGVSVEDVDLEGGPVEVLDAVPDRALYVGWIIGLVAAIIVYITMLRKPQPPLPDYGRRPCVMICTPR